MMGKKDNIKKICSSFFLLVISIGGLLLGLMVSVSCRGINEVTYDIAIINGYIITGDGSPAFQADIGIREKKIARIGRIKREDAVEIIDADGLYVSPGFIDIHTHTDRQIVEIPTADNYLLQGVTTMVGGNCGSYRYPLDQLFLTLETQGIGINFCCFVGHNTVRWRVMGYEERAPGRDEMEQMKAIIEEEMRNGAIGFSTGLAYRPGRYSTTSEVVELASAAARYGGLYASHTRNEGERVHEAVKEAIWIGEANNMRVQISHIKLNHPFVWRHTHLISRPIEAARERGLKVTTDQYPYSASAFGLYSIIPDWAFGEGWDDFLRYLEDPQNYETLKAHYLPVMSYYLERVYITQYEPEPAYQGKNLGEILIMMGLDPSPENGTVLLIEFQREGYASAIIFSMDEQDVEDMLKWDYNMIASDGHFNLPDEEGLCHPRNYGTYPRVISHCVKEKGLFTLEEAIRKMTALPADTLELKDRGMIKKRMYADLVIFDFDTIRDTASYTDSHRYPDGIRFVIINGEIAVREGALTGQLAGKVIYGPGKQ